MEMTTATRFASVIHIVLLLRFVPLSNHTGNYFYYVHATTGTLHHHFNDYSIPSYDSPRLVQQQHQQQQQRGRFQSHHVTTLLPRFHQQQQQRRQQQQQQTQRRRLQLEKQQWQVRGGDSDNSNRADYDAAAAARITSSLPRRDDQFDTTPNAGPYHYYPPLTLDDNNNNNNNRSQDGNDPMEYRHSPETDEAPEYWDTATTATTGTEFPNESMITVQEQFDSWKRHQLQQQQQQQQQSTSSSSPYVDSKGQTKLLVSINKTSRAVIFFIYMWRILHVYETVTGGMAATTTTTMDGPIGVATTNSLAAAAHLLKFRPVSLVSVPLLVLFLSNLMATITLLVSTATNHSTKKRLKAILNLNKFVEVMVIGYTFVRLTIVPSPYVTKEIYIGRILHSILFIIQGQAYTRFSWDSEAIAPSFQQATTTTSRTTTTTNTNATPQDTGIPVTAGSNHNHNNMAQPQQVWRDESYNNQR